MYHRENAQEGFLVVAGECLLIVEGQERQLTAWDSSIALVAQSTSSWRRARERPSWSPSALAVAGSAAASSIWFPRSRPATGQASSARRQAQPRHTRKHAPIAKVEVRQVPAGIAARLSDEVTGVAYDGGRRARGAGGRHRVVVCRDRRRGPLAGGRLFRRPREQNSLRRLPKSSEPVATVAGVPTPGLRRRADRRSASPRGGRSIWSDRRVPRCVLPGCRNARAHPIVRLADCVAVHADVTRPPRSDPPGARGVSRTSCWSCGRRCSRNASGCDAKGSHSRLRPVATGSPRRGGSGPWRRGRVGRDLSA